MTNPFEPPPATPSPLKSQDVAWGAVIALFALSISCVIHYASNLTPPDEDCYFPFASVVLMPLTITWFPLLQNERTAIWAGRIVVFNSVLLGTLFSLAHFRPLLLPHQSFEIFAAHNRLFGPYWWAYWPRFVCCAIVPLLLLSKRCVAHSMIRMAIGLITLAGYLQSYALETPQIVKLLRL